MIWISLIIWLLWPRISSMCLQQLFSKPHFLWLSCIVSFCSFGYFFPLAAARVNTGMAVSGWLRVRPRNSFRKGRGKQLQHNKNPKTPVGFAGSTLLQCVSLFHFLRQALLCVWKMHEGKLWFLVSPSTENSLFTTGIGINIS